MVELIRVRPPRHPEHPQGDDHIEGSGVNPFGKIPEFKFCALRVEKAASAPAQ
jgi:hypothetical protein